MTMTLVVVVLLAVAILPSALNIPQSNPNTVPEYAPVPPNEESQTSEQGNLAALGQAGGSNLSRSGGLPEAIPTAAAERRSGKRCVGDPPRQAEDPMSPPCVAFFEGDNFGATYRGVTRDEVIAVVYMDAGFFANVGDGAERTPNKGFCDVDSVPNSDPACRSPDTGQDHAFVKMTRSFSRYFNERYQTYNRHIHYWIYWGVGGTAEAKTANAAEVYERFKPFATLDITFSANKHAYLEAMARRGVMQFPDPIGGGATDIQPNAYYAKYPPHLFGFFPDVEHWADLHATYLCSRVEGFPVSHAQGGVMSDGSEMNGNARRYGFLSLVSPNYPGIRRFWELVKPRLNACGIVPEPDADRTYSYNGALWGDAAYQEAANNVAAWRRADVTTILWLGGWADHHPQVMDQAQYYPEVVFAGNLNFDDAINARLFLPQKVWRNAWGTTWQVRVDSLETGHAYRACKEGDETLTRGNCDLARNFYLPHFMLARSIQAAGPRLTPARVDRGLHAYPKIASNSPYVAACFFDPGDYTCVKDSAELWWDPAAQPESQSGNGCYRLTAGGARYLAGEWPRSDDAFKPENAPCTDIGYGGLFRGPG